MLTLTQSGGSAKWSIWGGRTDKQQTRANRVVKQRADPRWQKGRKTRAPRSRERPGPRRKEGNKARFKTRARKKQKDGMETRECGGKKTGDAEGHPTSTAHAQKKGRSQGGALNPKTQTLPVSRAYSGQAKPRHIFSNQLFLKLNLLFSWLSIAAQAVVLSAASMAENDDEGPRVGSPLANPRTRRMMEKSRKKGEREAQR